MNINHIKTGQTERIFITALDSNKNFLTGLTDVLLEIRRNSDGYYYDFSDTTFKNSGWITRQKQIIELNVTYSSGTYYYDFSTLNLLDDTYYIRISSNTADNSPFDGELKVGDYLDYLDASISSRASSTSITNLETQIERILGLCQENFRIIDPTYSDNGSLLTATIKIYESANDCDLDQNEIATYSIVSTYNANGTVATYKVTKD